RVRDELTAAANGTSREPNGKPAPKPSANASPPVSIDRPPGLTRMIREFYRTILSIRAEDLTSADRSALRSVFKALAILARAPTPPREPVFPPLPAARAARARSTGTGGARQLSRRANQRRGS